MTTEPPLPIDAQFENFIRDFNEVPVSIQQRSKYDVRLGNLAFNNSRILIIDFLDLFTSVPDLAKEVLDSPDEVKKPLESAALARLKLVDPEYAEQIGKNLQIAFANLIATTELRYASDQIGHLIMVRGVITRITAPQQVLTNVKFQCRKCNETITVAVDNEQWVVRGPGVCPHCRSKFFTSNLTESKRVRFQQLTIEEMPEDLQSGRNPAPMAVRLFGELVDKTTAGSQVALTGIPHAGFSRHGKQLSPTLETWIEGNHVENLDEDAGGQVTKEDITQFLNEVKESFFETKMVNSICPSILGLTNEKQAALYQLIGGEDRYHKDHTYRRGFSHVLLIGDPSVAKTTLLRYIANLAPKGRYATALGASGRGLTAILTKEPNGAFTLTAGTVVLASRSIACLDEIEKMDENDRVLLHESMETGKITVAKGGFNTELNAQTAILAAGNPAFGRYDSYKNITDNVNLPITLLSRFDLIFIIKDVPDPVHDGEIVKHMLDVDAGRMLETIPDIYSPEFIRKFVQYAKTIHPTTTHEAEKAIEVFYLKMRAPEPTETPIALTTRQAQAIMRLSESRARLFLRKEVIKEDVTVASKLLQFSLKAAGIDVDVGKQDIDTIMTGTPKSLRDKLTAALNTMIELEKEHGPQIPEDIAVEILAKHLAISPEEARQIFHNLCRDGMLFMPKPNALQRTRGN